MNSFLRPWDYLFISLAAAVAPETLSLNVSFHGVSLKSSQRSSQSA